MMLCKSILGKRSEGPERVLMEDTKVGGDGKSCRC
jgi:hypothetical protein